MNIPDKKVIDILDNLTKSNINFALYRLPWTDECHLVMQEAEKTEEFSSLSQLNRQKGFLMAPFDIAGNEPIILIRPDITAFDWDEIEEILEKYKTSTLESERLEITISEENNEDGNYKKYSDTFDVFQKALNENKFQKLVLSRNIAIKLDDDFSPSTSFINACNDYPRMMIYMCHTENEGTWIGSTPEILINGQKSEWHTVALAGTMNIDKTSTQIEWSKKNLEEQKYVADYIREIIKSLNNKAKLEEKGPYPSRAGELMHLKSDFFFSLQDNCNIGDILNNLHPTPAVCGLPKDNALQFIRENEGYNRKYYSGIVGWLDNEVETDLYVNLRCMQISNQQAILYAGGGIMKTSTMEDEWNETKSKLATMEKVIIQTKRKI